MKSIKNILTKIQSQYDGRVEEIKRLNSRLKELKRAGIEYGTPTFKSKRYMRIVKPATEDNPRTWVYVGSDKDKQEEAIAAIERGREFDEISEQIGVLTNSLDRIREELLEVEGIFDWSLEPARRRRVL